MASGGKIPSWIKISYTILVCVLVPVYWLEYSPANFLWFSNIALLVTVAALWLESRWLASMQAVSVSLLELAWIGDFLAELIVGNSAIGLVSYMFDAEISLPVRGLSLYHLVLPFLLLWIVYRLGYEQRAWIFQTLLAWVVLPICYFFTDPDKNINWIFGPGGESQDWMPPALYAALVMLAFPICVYYPTHLVLRYLFEKLNALAAEESARTKPGS